MHDCVQLCQDPQTEVALLREGLGVSRINHILRVHGHTSLQERGELPKSSMKLGRRPLRGSFQVHGRQLGTSHAQCWPVGYWVHKGARRGWPSTPWRIHCSQTANSQDAATAGYLPEQPLLARLDAVIEGATVAYLEALLFAPLGLLALWCISEAWSLKLSSKTMTCALESLPTASLVSVIYERHALIQPLPSAVQLANRNRSARFLSDLVFTSAFPPYNSEFSLPVSTRHMFGLTATVTSLSLMTPFLWPPPSTCSSSSLSPQQRYPRKLT